MTDQPTDRLTLDEAAAALGISREAVRLRVRRGTIPGERVNGVWYVTLVGRQPDGQRPTTTNRPGPRDELVAQLRGEVDYLRSLTQYQAGLIAELSRRTVEIPPTTPAAQPAPPPTPATPRGMPPSGPEKPVTRRKAPPWWYRWFPRRRA